MKPIQRKISRRYPAPRYPTKLEIMATPELLARHVPPAWLTHKEIAGALGVLLLANAGGCSDKLPAGNGGSGAANDRLSKAAIVAPIFEHGEGRGATGCIVVTPPLFLSEHEALVIIKDELGRRGLQPSETKAEMEGARIPRRVSVLAEDFVTGRPGELAIASANKSDPLFLQLKDVQRRVGIAYVHRDNHIELGAPQSFSTVRSYDFREVAHWVQGNARKSGKGVYLGVFYDPLARPSPPPTTQTVPASAKRDTTKQWLAETKWTGSNEGKKQQRAESQRLLREQVKDFVDWLQAQGAI